MRKPKWYIDNALKPPKSFWDWCYSQMHIFKWQNKQKTILSSERKNCPVIEKRLTKNSKLTFDDQFYSFCIVLVTVKRIEIQTYCFWSEVVNGKQKIKQELTNLEYIGNDQQIQIGKWWSGYSIGLVRMTDMGGPYTGVKYFKNDWESKVKTISELKYIDFSNSNDLWVSHLHHLYKYRREIEYLQKINATKIARQLMGGHGIDMRTFSQSWLKRHKQLLKNSTLDFNNFEMKRRITQRRGKIVPGIEKYMKYSDLNIVPAGVGIIRFQNWVIKNKVYMQDYRDYMNLLKDLEIKPDTENLIIPKDLKKAHDNAVSLLNQLDREVGSRKYERRKKHVLKLEKTLGQYVFLVPKELNEIIVEGKKLSHCVGSSSYISDHKNGRTTIVFVRRKSNPDEPYFTLEYRSKEIKQLRGKHNKSAPAEVKEAANRWLRWANEGCKRGKNKVKDQKEKASAA